MEQQVELKKVFGDVFVKIKILPGNAFVLAQWQGVQSEETVMQGGYKIIEMVKACSCTKLLNSNKDVIGSWDMALEWAEKVWTPSIKAAGLKFLAQVIPSSIYASISIENLIHRIDNEFEIRTFEDEALAEAWLRSVN